MYGIFSFDMNSMGVRFKNDSSSIHLVLMRNMAGLPKRYILRTFDLKGSEYQREVLKDNWKEEDLSKRTLKDKDFDLVEGRLKIDNEIAKRGTAYFSSLSL